MSQNREKIDPKYTWDLSTVFATDKDWEVEEQALTDEIAKETSAKGQLLDSAETLLSTTERYLGLMRRLEKLYVYASMTNDQDTRVAKYQAYQSKASGLYAKFNQVFAFYEPELMTVSPEQLDGFFTREPKLLLYRHFFENILRQKTHILPQAIEEVLAGASEIFQSASETFEILDNADLRFPWVSNSKGEVEELTHGNYITLMESLDRDIRKEAYEAMYGTYEQFQHTYAKTLQTTIKVNNFKAQLRNYRSSRQAALDENAIPEMVYDTLIDSVHRHLPLLHRYLELRRKILGLDELKMYDIYVPLSSVTIPVTYEEALALAEKALSVLGTDYNEKVKCAFSQRWIDVHINSGKRSGAYSGGAYDTNAFMLLNWQDNLDNLYTLVHETGHSLHSTFTREHQPYVYGDYSIFLAEIASTTNENILTEVLLKEEKDPQKRLTLLNNYLDSFRGTIFRQTQFAEFEQIIHRADQEGEVLTSDYLNNQYAILNEKYYALSRYDNPEIQYEWARIPHFYYNFYVYQYATGFAAATYLADRIVHGYPEEKESYLEYLKAGSSAYPLEIMAKAGIDMTDSSYLEDAFKVFERRLNELEDLVEELSL